MSQANHLASRIVPFYLGREPDSEGRTIEAIWAWDLETLENIHDYIQWLFPLAERSAFNLSAPLIDQTVIRAFRDNEVLQQNLRRSLEVMLNFYGLRRQESSTGALVVIPSDHYSSRQGVWVSQYNHNYLRITRILRCLMLLGLEDEAQAFYGCLGQIYRESSDRVGQETFQYWTSAIGA
ncbi:MAG: opioid growth factor receptor-related protein [Nodosilinea sp.]